MNKQEELFIISLKNYNVVVKKTHLIEFTLQENNHEITDSNISLFIFLLNILINKLSIGEIINLIEDKNYSIMQELENISIILLDQDISFQIGFKKGVLPKTLVLDFLKNALSQVT